jgi:hypothetical protein
MRNKFIRQLIKIEIKLGFLSIPSYGVELMPGKNIKIDVIIDGKKRNLSYNSKYRRIFGLTGWYKKNKALQGDEITLSKKSNNKYELSFKKKSEGTEKESEKLLDLSGLSTQAKGDIVEDRIKELLLLHGQGLLSVYRPVTDTEGIDFIIVRSGQFHPIFLQVKGRYNLHKNRSLILSVKTKTFTSHDNFFVIGAFFNPKTLEIDEKILLIPSKNLEEIAIKVNSKKGEWYRIVSSIHDNYSGKWSKYLIKKDELATKLIERFEEINRYIK